MGSLDHVGLPTLLTMLEMERRSGVIEVRNLKGHRARLTVREGRVLRATMREHTLLLGREAVCALLAWTEGQFTFTLGPVDERDMIGCSTSHLLLDAARRTDELAA
jgi:hypothetical protein